MELYYLDMIIFFINDHKPRIRIMILKIINGARYGDTRLYETSHHI